METMGDYPMPAPSDGSPIADSLDDTFADEFGLADRGLDSDHEDNNPHRSKVGQDETPPSWSELKTKAGKDRKRLPLACIACRRKKIRCSGEKPSCKHCLRSRMPCVYKVTTRKAAPRTDYMAMLDKRLKRMEERIIKVIPKTEQDSVKNVARAVLKPAVPGSQTGVKSHSKKRSAGAISGPDLEAWAKSQPTANVLDGAGPMALKAQEEGESELFREGADALPAKETQTYLAEVFFDNVYGQAYHLLHKPSYMRKLQNGTLPPVLILCVCAVSARFAASPDFRPSARQFLRGDNWASRARDICARRYEWPNLTILTCLLILGLHEFGTCQGGRSWALGGQAIRMAFALQLHKDLEYDPLSRGQQQLSFVDREIRRRLMWSCFLMDRFCSSGTDRPIFIRENSIKIPLPVRENLFRLDMPAITQTLDGCRPASTTSQHEAIQADPVENMGVAAYTIRAVALFGRIISYVNQGGRDSDPHPMTSEASEFAKLAREAEVFHENLPERLRYSMDNLRLHQMVNVANNYLLLHVTIQQNILLINRTALNNSEAGSSMEKVQQLVADASLKTFSAATQISEILKDTENSQCSITAPFAGYCAFSATTVHIIGIFCGNPSLKTSSENCAGINIKYLRRMMRYWGMFHWMVENVRSQYRIATEAARSGKTASPADQSTWALQYGDWFDRYPHGVPSGDANGVDVKEEQDQGVSAAVLEQKPEQQSVEEFFTNIPSSPAVSSPEKAVRGTAAKRRSAASGSTGRQARANSVRKAKRISTPTLQTSSNRGTPSEAPSLGKTNATAVPKAQEPSEGSTPALAISGQSTETSYSMSPIQPAQGGLKPSFPENIQTHTNSLHPELMPVTYTDGHQAHAGLLPQRPVFDDVSMASNMQQSGQPLMDPFINWGANAPGLMNFGMGAPQAQLHGQVPQEMINDYTDQDPSLAWFMPFNLEPPAIDVDLHQDGARQDFVMNPLGDGQSRTLPPDTFGREM